MTPWHVMNGLSPSLARERMFGSRVYVTLPPEIGRNTLPKLHAERGWMGYYVGCESESVYRVYSEEKHRVFRVGVARVDDGEGTQDRHFFPSLTDRVPVPANLPADDRLGSIDPDSDDGASSASDDNDDDNQPAIPTPDENNNASSPASEESLIISEPSGAAEDDLFVNDDAMSAGHWTDDEEAPDPLRARSASTNDDTDHTPSEDGHVGETVSRFFAFMARQNFGRDKPGFDPLCRRCYQWGRKCDRTSIDEECGGCRTRKVYEKGLKCTNNLDGALSPADRANGRILPGVEYTFEPKGRTCTKAKALCRRTDILQKCEYCQKRRRKCETVVPESVVPGLQPVDTRVKRSRTLTRIAARKGKGKECHPSQVCTRCKLHHSICDGKRPCGKCILRGTKCNNQRNFTTPACVQCQYYNKTSPYVCNRTRPCAPCVRHDRAFCSYKEMDGLVIRKYLVPGAHLTKQSPKPDIDESDPECVNCKHDNMRCDRGTPCIRCVKGSKIKTCVFNRRDGFREEFTTLPYRNPTAEEGHAVLRENWNEELERLKPRQDARKARENEDPIARQLFGGRFTNGFRVEPTQAEDYYADCMRSGTASLASSQTSRHPQ